MDAVVLAGGLGTRLRPLTNERPKHVLPLVDRPVLAYLLDQLRHAGVERAVLSCGFLPDAIQAEFGSGGERLGGLRLEYAVEEEALGTAGAIRFAADAGGIDGSFLALNGDIVSDMDLGVLVTRHREAGARATIALVAVEDPSRYGVVDTAPDGAVRSFVEKPPAAEAPSNRINAGAYVLERDVLDGIPAGRAVSIEREIFPRLVGHGLHAFELEGYWLDVGTPESYLTAHRDLLTGAMQSRLEPGAVTIEPGAEIATGAVLEPPVWIGAGAVVGADCVIGPHVAVGPASRVGAGSRVADSVLHPGSEVMAGCIVQGSIVGGTARVAAGTSVGPLAVVGR
jgi:NDP-sugar pyrophosphorylase family protein